MWEELRKRTGSTLGHARLSLLLLSAVCSLARPGAGEIPTENPSSTPALLTPAGKSLFFTADDGVHGRETWQWSPDAGTGSGNIRLLEDLFPGPSGSDPRHLFHAVGRLYINAALSADGPRQFFVWDEALSRFEPIIEPVSNQPVRDADPDVVIGDALYFTAAFSGRQRTTGIVRLPGRVAEIVLPQFSVNSDQFSVLPDQSYVFGSPTGLFRTQGTPESTVSVFQGSGTLFVLSLGAKVFFAPDTAEYGMEPWATDGTREGTHLLKDILPGPNSSTFGQLRVFQGEVYFNPDDGVHGSELWKSDGTEEGTVLVKDILPGSGGSDAHYFCPAGDRLFFVASDFEHGKELWKTDGTPGGTQLVADLHPGAQGTDIWSLVEFNGKLFFCGSTPENGEELFQSDGTREGTTLVCDILPGPGNAGPANLTPVGDCVFFTCNDAMHGEELWQTDGTAEGTRLVSDIALPRYNPSSSPHDLHSVQDKLFFAVNDITHGEELWVSDGTEAGTSLLSDISPGQDSSAPADLVAWRDTLFFAASAPDTGRELWRTDGTPGGTALFLDILPGAPGAAPKSLCVIEDTLYFSADDGTHGRELWSSDGTPTGTRLVRNLVPGGESAQMTRVFRAGNQVCLYVLEDLAAAALWCTQGSGESTFRLLTIRDFFSSADLDFVLSAPPRTDEVAPTVAGTMDRALIPVVCPISDRSGNGRGAVIGSKTYFVARSAAQGAELWETDGTLAGTRLFCDAYPGTPSSSPRFLTALGNTLYFVADTPLEGRVLWRSSAAPESARPVSFQRGYVRLGMVAPDAVIPYGGKLLVSCASPINPSTDRAHLALIGEAGETNEYSDLYVLLEDTKRFRFREITVCESNIFFTFDDGLHGEELWVSNGMIERLVPGSTHLVKDILPYGDLSPWNR